MDDDIVFNIAENEQGELVFVDDVPRGKKCRCRCPNCHEDLAARQGELRAHHFYHLSEKRGANLKICYAVTLYKLAEQIIKKEKRIYAPSYYGIFKGKDLEFDKVKVDSSYEREDKQPDVIALTKEGKQYLIEFVFEYKVQHKKAIDYKNLNCIEINLSNQVLDRGALQQFLLYSDNDRSWLNNDEYFGRIEERYKSENKNIRLVHISDCEKCDVKTSCCAVQLSNNKIVIENNGDSFRICKTDEFNRLNRKEEKEKKQHLKQPEYKTERMKYYSDQQTNQDTLPDKFFPNKDVFPQPKIPQSTIEVKPKKTEFDENIEKILEYVNRPDFNSHEECDFLKRIGGLSEDSRSQALYVAPRKECQECPDHRLKQDGRWHICNRVNFNNDAFFCSRKH